MTALSCLPQSICSWNYFITVGDSDTTASVEFNFWNETGSITSEFDFYNIEHAWLSGQWLLKVDDRVVAVAIKPNPLLRYFKVTHNNQDIVLRAESPFTRSFLVEQHDNLLGTIQPMHPFTRRASMDCSSSIPIAIQVFMFWLTVLMWKRAANSSGAGAAGAAR